MRCWDKMGSVWLLFREVCGESSRVHLLSDQPGLHFNLITNHKSMKETTITNYVCQPPLRGVVTWQRGAGIICIIPGDGWWPGRGPGPGPRHGAGHHHSQEARAQHHHWSLSAEQLFCHVFVIICDDGRQLPFTPSTDNMQVRVPASALNWEVNTEDRLENVCFN